MKVSFRVGRYLVALFCNWFPPFLFGAAASMFVSMFALQQTVQDIGDAFESAIGNVVESCREPEQTVRTGGVDHV